MKSKFLIWALILISLQSSNCSSSEENVQEQEEESTPTPDVKIADVFAEDYWDDAVLVWSDEFDGQELSLENWSFETGNHGWGNNELQNYVEGSNVEVGDGTLKIIARLEDSDGRRYTSTRLNSKRDFRYGKIEIRAKIPDHKGKGLWPALWMLGNDIGSVGWPSCGEIDIMEYVSFDPDTVHFSIHSDANNHINGTQITSGPIILETVEEEFHTYGLLWTDKYLKFYIDDPENVQLNFLRPTVSSIENWPFSKHFYFLFNIAVGGNWGGLEGVDDSIFPAVMEVDFVRVYQVQ